MLVASKVKTLITKVIFFLEVFHKEKYHKQMNALGENKTDDISCAHYRLMHCIYYNRLNHECKNKVLIAANTTCYSNKFWKTLFGIDS